jgi:hypothetical protein
LTNGIKKRVFNYGMAVSDLLSGFANKYDAFTNNTPGNIVNDMKSNYKQNRTDLVAGSTGEAPPIQDPFGSDF